MKIIDQEERDSIRKAPEKSLVVEAAAGTGKTSELVERMIAVIGAGKTTIDKIIGVTFTERAAGRTQIVSSHRAREGAQH
jgi:ATP-dependent helicase/nuclease subunit A